MNVSSSKLGRFAPDTDASGPASKRGQPVLETVAVADAASAALAPPTEMYTWKSYSVPGRSR